MDPSVSDKHSKVSMLCKKWKHPKRLDKRVLEIRHVMVTCEEASAPPGWAWSSWHPCPSCRPAGQPRPWSCGCSSLEEFLPHDSSETHLHLETRKVCGEENRILMMTSWGIVSALKFWTHVTQSRRFSRAAMCKGESPWMFTACRSLLAFSSSSAMSTLPENAAQWRQMFSS